MAKAAPEKSTRVMRPKKSLLSAVAESSKKTAAPPKPAKVVEEKPSSKAAGKRKLTENDESVEKVKKAKRGEAAAPAAKKVEAAKTKAGKEDKLKGKKKEEPVDSESEAEAPAAPVKTKDAKAKKAPAKSKAKSPSPSPAESDAEEQSPSEAEEEDVQLFGFSTDDDDSSDDDMNDEPDAVDVGKLPTIAKDDAVVKRKLEQAKKKPTADRGVIYLGRVPHGFYEEQMKSYFSQFGDVTRLRLSRNKRTGRSKHYAFIEFESSSVAQIVAETMDNYLLMGHILTCKVIPKDEVHPELWVGANKKWRSVPKDRVARVQHNKPRTAEEQEKAEKRLLKRQSQKKRKLEEVGIKYDIEAVGYKKKSRAAES